MTNTPEARPARLAELPEDERAALVAWRDRHGSAWRAELAAAWRIAAAGPELQRLRNGRGPAWLVRLADSEFDPPPAIEAETIAGFPYGPGTVSGCGASGPRVSAAVLAVARTGELVHSSDGAATGRVVEVVEDNSPGAGRMRRHLYVRWMGHESRASSRFVALVDAPEAPEATP